MHAETCPQRTCTRAQVEVLKKDQFRAGQALFALRTRERELISEISGARARPSLLTQAC